MNEIRDTLIPLVDPLLQSGWLGTVMFLLRMITPLIALYVVWRSFTSFRKGQRSTDPVILLHDTTTGAKFPVLYWENSIGRSRSSDIQIPDNHMSRDHAVLMRRKDGWLLQDTGSKQGTLVNGARITEPELLELGDKITMGTTTLILQPAENATPYKRRVFKGFSKEAASPFMLMVCVTLVQLLMTVQLMLGTGTVTLLPLIPFSVLFLTGWILYFISRRILKRVSFEIETTALLLSSIGILLLAGEGLSAVTTQLVAFVGGVVVFCLMVWFLGNLELVMRTRMLIAVLALLLFVANLVLGTVVNGSRNWIFIGPVSIQPSELIKIAFVFVGTSTLDHLQTKKNITGFIAFAAACLAFLFIMRDFGTALIFFACFLIISFMRSGNIRTIILILAAAVFGVFLILQFLPYVANRFSGWMHVWEHPQDSLGYQQVRTLTYMASGGLFGMGLGNGCLKYIAAADCDLVFGMLCEEQGFAMGLVVLAGIAMFTLYARSEVTRSRSTFHAIAACAVAGMLLFQTCLNIFGPTDILPLTGVTLPFISAGGTSMLSTWGLMAFLKASDERTYAAKRGTRRQQKAAERRRQIENTQQIPRVPVQPSRTRTAPSPVMQDISSTAPRRVPAQPRHAAPVDRGTTAQRVMQVHIPVEKLQPDAAERPPVRRSTPPPASSPRPRKEVPKS